MPASSVRKRRGATFTAEQIAEPRFEDFDLGFGHRHVLRPVIGHRPYCPIALRLPPARTSLGHDERTPLNSRRGRRVARRSAHAGAAIFESKPWRHCGKLGRSTERPNSTPYHAAVLRPRASSAAWAQSRTASHDRMAAKSRASGAQSRPQAGGAGRAKREP